MTGVEVIGLKDLLHILKKVKEDTIKEVVQKATLQTFYAAKRKAAKHFKTGTLEHNIYMDFKLGGKVGEVGVDDRGMLVSWKGQRVNYAIFVHFGTRPHEIKPKKARALAFVKGDKLIFAKRVRHPGYVGDPFLYNALQEAAQKLQG